MTLHRRSVLRGLVGGTLASLALPSLEAMFDADSAAFADGTLAPKRFGTWWWGCGVRLDRWIPKATGAAYPLSEELTPLQSVKDYVSVVSGTSDPYGATLGHHDGWVRMLTGSNETFDGAHGNGSLRAGDGSFINPSLDQVVAAQWAGQTPFSTIAIAVSQRGATGGPNYCVDTSQKGQFKGGSNPGTANPRELFDKLFAGVTTSTDPAARARSQAQGNMLSGFREDAKALQKKLGATDRARLDQYLTSVDEIDKRLKSSPGAAGCVVPNAPASMPNNLGNEDLRGRGRLLADVLAAALACDLTRSFAFMFSPMQATTIFRDLGKNEDYHTLSHLDQTFVHQAATYAMGELAYLLTKLRDTKEASGQSLLDTVAMFASSDVAQPDTHSTQNMPILVMGKGGGALRGGVHVNAGGQKFTAVHLTIFKALGLPLTQFGTGNAQTSATIQDLLT